MKLRWTRLAVEHLKAAHEFLSDENPAAAAKLIERILESVEVLGRYPQLGRKGRVEGARELALTNTPFVVAYRVQRSQVEILAVLHGARRWPESF